MAPTPQQRGRRRSLVNEIHSCRIIWGRVGANWRSAGFSCCAHQLIITTMKHNIYLSKVVRLVVLIPITSAAVERVFSQVKFIIETIGENGLQETLELRLMERVNKYD